MEQLDNSLDALNRLQFTNEELNEIDRHAQDSAIDLWKDAREQYLAGFEVSYAQSVLARCGGNVSAAAREAGVDRKTFYALLHRDREQASGEFIPQTGAEAGE